MDKSRIYAMPFIKVYSSLVNKAIRKGRQKSDVDEIISWLTGYAINDIDGIANSDLTYGDFFQKAPRMNPERFKIKGTICKIRIEEIADPMMKDIRILDKLIDDLAKGKDPLKVLSEH